MKIDMVSSSKLLMKAITQPLTTPGTINGRMILLNVIQGVAPND